MMAEELWTRHRRHLSRAPAFDQAPEVSRMRFDEAFPERMATAMQRAFRAMDELDRGAIAKPDENRMAGHCSLPAFPLAPTVEIAAQTGKAVADLRRVAPDVQQPRERVPDLFAPSIRVLESGGSALEVEPGVTAGDYPPLKGSR